VRIDFVLNQLRFRPTLWPTLFTVPALLMMIGLCVWQVQRLYWKEGLIAERQARVAEAAIPLPAAGGDLGALEFRKVGLEGSFQHDKELYLGARSLNGNPGYWILTPFTLADGQVVLVNRGWVPVERKLPEHRADGQVAGRVAVEGLVRLPHDKAFMQPDNEPQHNMWFFIDLPAMATHAALPLRTDLYVDAGPAESPGGYPLGGQTRIELPNDHLQYALTWGLLALALIVIYVVYHLKLERERTS
jgi:surfeit locus 1 family protein